MPIGHNTAPTHHARTQLGADLRTQRERLGMTQRDLSTITGISQNSISRIEQALADPLVSSVLTVAGAVGRRVVLVADHHLPLLNLTADEVDALRDAAYLTELHAPYGQTPRDLAALRSALDKLTEQLGQYELDHAGEVIPASPQVLAAAAALDKLTTTEETGHA